MARKPEFVTVPDELLECAHAVLKHFRDWGFRVSIEPAAIVYPMTPTMVCKHQDRTVIVEVHSTISRQRLEDWVTYCASCDRNRELVVCIPADSDLPTEIFDLARELRVGVIKADSETVQEVLRPYDLAMRAELPRPENLPSRVRKALRDTYEHWNRGDWKDAFGLATEALDEHAKDYLKRDLDRGRITVLDRNGAPRQLTPEAVDKMTLGQLAIAFSNIQAPTDIDATIAAALNTVNDDRVALRHYRNQRAVSAGFRRRVGQHMHVIVRALREVLSTK